MCEKRVWPERNAVNANVDGCGGGVRLNVDSYHSRVMQQLKISSAKLVTSAKLAT